MGTTGPRTSPVVSHSLTLDSLKFGLGRRGSVFPEADFRRCWSLGSIQISQEPSPWQPAKALAALRVRSVRRCRSTHLRARQRWAHDSAPHILEEQWPRGAEMPGRPSMRGSGPHVPRASSRQHSPGKRAAPQRAAALRVARAPRLDRDSHPPGRTDPYSYAHPQDFAAGSFLSLLQADFCLPPDL